MPDPGKNPFKPGTKEHDKWNSQNKKEEPKKETPEQKAAREKKEALAKKEAEKAAAKKAAEKAAEAKAKKDKMGGKVSLRSKTADKMAKETKSYSNVKSSAEVAKEVGRGGFRAGKAGVEISKSGLRSVHDLTLEELFPGYKKS
jgi:colicin import membrane protein